MQDPKTLFDLLRVAAERFPDNGITVNDNSAKPSSRLTYAQLYQDAQDKGKHLRQKGMIPENRIVVLYFDSHLDNIRWCWAVIAAGGVPAILSPLPSEEKTLRAHLEHISKTLDGPITLTSTHYEPLFKSVPGFKVFRTAHICLLIPGLPPPTLDGVYQPQETDLAVLLFTSGSTGHAKAVEFTHSQLLSSVKAKYAFHGTSHNTKFLTWISFDHSANFCEIHLTSLYAGSDQYHAGTLDMVNEPANFFNIIGTHGIGYAFAPSFFLAAATRSFLDQKIPPFLDFSQLSVIMTGGEANKTCNIEAADKILTTYGAKPNSIRIAYGLSETCSACFYNTEAPSYDTKRENTFISVGKPIPNVIEYRVVDDAGDTVPPNTPGSIDLRGEVVFNRYHNNPSVTEASLTPDGWFRTGDLGSVDENGQLSIVGRIKDIIIINGNNYSSFELENCIETDNADGVTPTYTATFGVWDEKTNTESIVVLFHPKQSEEGVSAQNTLATMHGIESSVIKFCSKAPKDIIPLPKTLLPKSTLGKLSRTKLKQQYKTGLLETYRVPYRLSEVPDTNGKANGVNGHANGVNGHANGTNGHSNGVNGHTNGTNGTNGVNGNHTNGYEESHGLVTEMQQTIAGIICKEVKIPVSSITAEYELAQLGIDSLSYMRIRKNLEAAFGLENSIPMSTLLQSKSVRDLEERLLAAGTVPQKYEPIVPLQTSGSKMPLFLCHPGSGEVLCWLAILKYLPDRPLYAIRAKGLHKTDGYFNTLDEMINCYVDAIRQYQPHGPYALLGFCLGGVTAFEIAKRLEADGEEIAFLGGIDGPADLRKIRVLENFRNILTEFLPQMGVISQEQMDEFNTEHDDDTPFEDLYRALVGKFGEAVLVPFDLTLPGLIQRARVDWSMRGLFKEHRPAGQVSKYDVFWVDPLPALKATEEQWRYEIMGEWDTYSKTPVNYYKVLGNHLNCMQGEENVQAFQEALNNALKVRNI